jgi:enoyl-CoA hydratase/carnithine racemase
VTQGRAGSGHASLQFEIGRPLAGAATVTLCRPQRRNAMTPAMWRELAAFGRSRPAGVRVVVVRGQGPSFSAGIDLAVLAGGGGEDDAAGNRMPPVTGPGLEDWIAGLQEGFHWLRDSSIVSVAAVQGHAIGAGFQLALGCDLRILADDARLCMKEPTLGLVPDLLGTKPLVDIVGLPRALEICLTGRQVTAAEARELRLAELVVPAAELDAAVTDLVSALLAIDPAVAKATKELLSQAAGNSLTQQAAAERQAQAALLRARSKPPHPPSAGSAGPGRSAVPGAPGSRSRPASG